MKEITQQLLTNYFEKTAKRLDKVDANEEEQLWSYRKAAALLHCFIPDRLRPLERKFEHNSPLTLLFDDIVPFSGGFANGLYTLKPALRNSAIKKFLSVDDMLNGLLANPARIFTPLQEMWESYLLTNELPSIKKLSYRDLINLHQISVWLKDIDKKLPSPEVLLKQIKCKSVSANFEHLVTSNFTGRIGELELLREHIKDSSYKIRPILSIFGPGGIGKSALLGKILIERVVGPKKERIPYVYLAFDQPSLQIDKPHTIFLEAASQLELQYPELKKDFNDFRLALKELGSQKFMEGYRGITYSTRSERNFANDSLSNYSNRLFARLLNAVSNYVHVHSFSRNVLITFDTFEEVQYRDRESLYPFLRMLQQLVEEFPPLRILIAGRTSVESSLGKNSFLLEIPLIELEIRDRILLLERLGIRDNLLTKMIAERVGGNPLSLRLAAQVVTNDRSEGRKDDELPMDWLLFKMDENLIQGQLYKRILNHIHNENVRKLAHPGMVLRKVTPDLIISVLAPTCEVEISSTIQAKLLFDELKREHALVQSVEFDTLKYRPEIRQVMVKLLQQDKYEDVRILHAKAIQYYENRDTLEDRAEELYHRLAIGTDDPRYLSTRWNKGVAQSVVSSFEEYSDRMKAWLASVMSLEVSRDVFKNASIIEWERNIIRKIKRAMLHMQVDQALNLLHERPERSISSPLYALEAKAHLLLSDVFRADLAIDRGIRQVSQSPNRGRLAELLWLKSQIFLMNKVMDSADNVLLQSQLAIQNSKDPLVLIHILCHRLLIRKIFTPFRSKDIETLRGELNAACLRLNKNHRGVPEFIVVLALSFLDEHYPKVRKRLLEYFPSKLQIHIAPRDEWNMLVSENLRGLEKYRDDWENDDDDDYEKFEQEFNAVT